MTDGFIWRPRMPVDLPEPRTSPQRRDERERRLCRCTKTCGAFVRTMTEAEVRGDTLGSLNKLPRSIFNRVFQLAMQQCCETS